jgi:uncharacterized protein
MSPTPEGMIDLLDWRRQVFELYQQVRLTWQDDPAKAYEHWRSRRNQLVGVHPQSPLAASARPGFAGLHHYPYNPALAFNATIETATEERFDLPVSTGGTMTFIRCGHVHLPVGTLDVYWLDTYGGGLFLPFRDATAGTETYGGGRYLLDTVKGADLGATADGQPCSTSTSPTTPAATTDRTGPARFRHRPTGSMRGSRRGSAPSRPATEPRDEH